MISSASMALQQTAKAVGSDERLAKATHGGLMIEAFVKESDLWITFQRSKSAGGLAWRVPLFSAEVRVKRLRGDHLLDLEIIGSMGRHIVTLEVDEEEEAFFTIEAKFQPTRDLHLPFLPRDLVAFGPRGAEDRPKGRIEARQRRLNSGFCYFSLEEPDFGKVLYWQDLTALNEYFRATGTKPENAVGGEWPEVGYLAPTQPSLASMALPAGRATVINRAHLLVRRFPQMEEGESAWQFMEMTAAIYRRLEKPGTVYRDWISRSRRTLADLSRSPAAHSQHFGNLYFHPYTGAEHPDSMVQLSLLAAIHQWGRWQGRRHPLERRISAGLSRFYDRKLKALRRYLPGVTSGKDPDAVDSWYMYHPMANLAALAADGDKAARKLLFDTIDYGIRAARHFKYRWPIQYKIDTFEVITAVAADDLGQTDVGGMYAWVMLQAFSLSGEARYLDEAKAAIAAAEGMRFHLNYQANLTAWGAVACIKLWRITGDAHYLGQSYVYLASFFHNCQIWRSRIGMAAEYNNFLGVTCLQDAPYMAVYECFDSFAAFEQYLDLGGPALAGSVKLLVSEYCRYALDRAWFFYPDALQPEALACEHRNGHIDRKLSFPVEDLYPDGQPAGQVGQEIYGAGAAMVFATRAFHHIDGAPFLLHCDQFVRAMRRVAERAISFSLDGPDGNEATMSIVRIDNFKMAAQCVLRDARGQQVTPTLELSGQSKKIALSFRAPAQGHYTLSW